MSTHWYDDWENIKALGHYLAFYKICAAQVLQAYYEQPSNWQPEWEEMNERELQERRLASGEEETGYKHPLMTMMDESIRRHFGGR